MGDLSDILNEAIVTTIDLGKVAFTYNKNRKEFTMMASDARLNRYPAIIALQNPKTGTKVAFELGTIHKDREGDVTHATYIDGMLGLKLIIFND